MQARSSTIGELASSGSLQFGDGYRTKRSEHDHAGYRIVRVADISNNTISLDGPDFVSSRYASAIGAKAGRAGDILLTTKGTVGRVATMPETQERTVYSPQLCFFRVLDPNVLSPRFLSYWFSSSEFWGQANDRMNNTDMAAYINLADIRSLRITLPGIQQQRTIAEVLGALDEKIAANTKFSTTVMKFLETKFQLLGLNDDPQSNSAMLALGDLMDLNPKVVAPAELEPVYVDMQKLPVSSMGISEWEYRPARGGARFMNGDTLFARITPCLENRKTGYVDFLKAGQVAIGSTEFIVMRSRSGTPRALSYFIATSERFRTFAIRHMIGTSGRQRVSATDLKGYVLRKPDPAELALFGKLSEGQFELTKSLTDQSRTLAATRDALLPQLMSGKLRVKDAEALVSASV